jgi:UDP-N-acetylglucosamine 2-epimerase (non-hydrolysing)
MAPVIERLRAEPWAEPRVLATAQHRDLLDDIFRGFEIKPDVDLNVMQANQSRGGLTSRLATLLDQVLEDEKPDVVLAQGDTTSASGTIGM